MACPMCPNANPAAALPRNTVALPKARKPFDRVVPVAISILVEPQYGHLLAII